MPREYLTLPFKRHWKVMDGIQVYQQYMRRIPKSIRLNQKRWVDCVLEMFDNYIKIYGCPDIIHAHCVKWAGYAAMIIKERYNTPYIITEHCPRFIFEEELGTDYCKSWQLPLLKEAMYKADHVVIVSHELGDDIAPLFGNGYRHSVISNTIDTDFFTPPLQKKTARHNFVYPALLTQRKAHDVLFEALAIVKRTVPDVKLHLAGFGTDSKKMEKMISGYGIEDNVLIHGEIGKEELRRLYYQCNYLVFPSRSESQGLVCLESCACGTPFIATESIPVSLRFSDSCYIVPINDAQALAEKMLCSMDRENINMAELHQQVIDIASPDVFAKKFNKVISDTIQ